MTSPKQLPRMNPAATACLITAAGTITDDPADAVATITATPSGATVTPHPEWSISAVTLQITLRPRRKRHAREKAAKA